ncbi:hypothetical protein [Deinococcus sp.]|uniref:hypothetical protein n=1 Tax=Deinococcus sp. TaxID=47478 RepID=UPI0025BDEB13|nr:hypothetical protein [Deinococcus sp.]
MAYQGKLAGGLTVTLSQNDAQTTLSVESSGQRQSSERTTGAWKTPPKLWQSGESAVAEIDGDEKIYLKISGDGVQLLGRAPDLNGAEAVGLTKVPDDAVGPKMQPMKPMEPMQPMKPLSED